MTLAPLTITAMVFSQDRPLAVTWYRKAADLGNTDAMRNLGVAYESGNGVSKDTALALRWYHKSADLGDTEATLQVHRLPPQILTKDTAFMQLLHRPEGDGLLALSRPFVKQKQEIEAKLATIQDPELRARASESEWGK